LITQEFKKFPSFFKVSWLCFYWFNSSKTIMSSSTIIFNFLC